MADSKNEIIYIATELKALRKRMDDIEKSFGVHLWGISDIFVGDAFVLAKEFNLGPEICDIDSTYGHTKRVSVWIEGIEFISVYTKEEYEECYKKYTEVENNV